MTKEIERLRPGWKAREQRTPRPGKLPAFLPRRESRHEPESITCAGGCARNRMRAFWRKLGMKPVNTKSWQPKADTLVFWQFS